jgi:hypothetical protein
MKKISSLVALFIGCILCNCSSSDPTPTQNPNPNPNPGGGGDVTISSITPETLYADDEITINGTGFSTDPTKNIVQMGTPSGNFLIFQINDPGDPDPNDPYFKVVSATATKLVVKVKNEVAQNDLNYELSADQPYRVKVTVNGKSAMSAIQHSKRLPVFNLSYTSSINQVIGCSLYVQAGDSVHMSGGGFYGPCSVSIDGKPIIPVHVKSTSELRFLIPRNHFGELNDDCIGPTVKVKVTNGDGKFLEKDIYISQSPPMRVYAAAFSKPEYTAGETPTLTITGYSIYSSAKFHINNNIANGYSAEGSLGAHGYPDQVVLQIGADNGPGVYNVQIKNKETDSYGFTIASFKMN